VKWDPGVLAETGHRRNDSWDASPSKYAPLQTASKFVCCTALSYFCRFFSTVRRWPHDNPDVAYKPEVVRRWAKTFIWLYF